MTLSNQASWAQNEIFLLLGSFMDPTKSEEETYMIFKQLSGWMIFAKNDTLLSVYLEASKKRLPALSSQIRKQAAKKLVECAKSYRDSKEYKALLLLARDLIN